MYDEDEINRLLEEPAFEMANVSKQDTGLPYDLWIDSMGKDRKVQHSEPRIKVQVDSQFIPVILSENPQIPESAKKNGAVEPKNFKIIQKYIKAYLRVFLAHYNHLITDRQALMLLSRLEDADSDLVKQVMDKVNQSQNK